MLMGNNRIYYNNRRNKKSESETNICGK